ncbi:FAD:protein FMN transferase [Paucibacter sp. AS339]|uniref:FAD:protein FMN transferase n=1 Tax=Paucibacter hankyongi TaxID=3133434 RepID=UPI0030AC82FB
MSDKAEASTNLLGVSGRRRVLALALPLLGLPAWAAALPSSARTAGPASLRQSRPLMGTQVDIAVEANAQSQVAATELAPALERAYAEMARQVDMMSRYRADSVVSALKLAAGVQPVQVPPEMMKILLDAQQLARRSNGVFDITVGALKAWHFDQGQSQIPPAELIERQLQWVNYRELILNPSAGTAYLKRRGMAIDLGGIAKLPILEAGLNSLRAEGFENIMVNGGGDVLYSGRWQGRPWRIGLRDPRAPQQLLGVLKLEGRGLLASSGDYERCFVQNGVRQHHILNPRSGRPSQGLRGLSLLATGEASVAAVNGLGAAFMVGGLAAGRRHIEAAPGLEALMVDTRHGVWTSAGMGQALGPLA